MSETWYDVVPADAPLDQGDLIADCPVSGWRYEPIRLRDSGDAVGALRAAVEITAVDVVVMTQTCNLAQHLSQAFARFFMRVGLPTDIRRAW